MFVAPVRLAPGRSVRLAAHRAVLSWLVPIPLAIGAAGADASSLSAQVGHEHHDSTGHAAPAPADTAHHIPAMSPRDTMRVPGMSDMPRMSGMPERPFG